MCHIEDLGGDVIIILKGILKTGRVGFGWLGTEEQRTGFANTVMNARNY